MKYIYIRITADRFIKAQLFFVVILLFSQKIFSQPVINSFTPSSGPVGTKVTISGRNYDASPANNIVYFGAVKAKISSATSTEIVVTVPAGATYQPITVTTNTLTGYSARPFVVTFAGGVDSFTINSFRDKIDYDAGSYSQSISISDLNGDGKPDIAVTNALDNTISIFKNTSPNGAISFAAKADYSTGSFPRCVLISDINGDGKPDVVVSNATSNTISVLTNTSVNGSISFATRVDFPASSYPSRMSIGDLDLDGKPDIAVANLYSKTISVFKNSSAGANISFDAKVDYATTHGAKDVSIGDLDGDGRCDLAAVNDFSNTISVFRNRSNSGLISFEEKIDYLTGDNPTSASITDIDRDDRAEIVVTNGNSNTVSIFDNISNIGKISLAPKVDFSTGPYPDAVSVGDLNGDTMVDMAVANSNSNTVSILKNSGRPGTISFASKVDYKTAMNTAGVFISDLDGDGKNDLASSISGDKVSVLRNRIGDAETVISAFTPTNAGAGSIVTITGKNFAGATEVSFGGKPALTFSIKSDTTISAMLGVGSSGSVSVTTTDYGIATLAGFNFIPAPTIASFTPVSGISGTSVKITGTNFTGATSVSFGGVAAASFKVDSSTNITAIVDSGATGSVSVTTPGGTATKSGFTYLPPIIYSVYPPSAGAGTSILIYGNNLSSATAVSFGNVPAASFKVVSPTDIRAVVGNGASGSVSIITPGGTADHPGFTFIPAPVITSFTPLRGGEEDTVTISGEHFTGTTSVAFGGTSASSFTVVSDGSIAAVVSTGANGKVSVTTAGGTTTFGTFTYTSPPPPVSCVPSYGANACYKDTSFIAGFKLLGEENTFINNKSGGCSTNNFSDYTAALPPVKMARGSAYSGTLASDAYYFDKVNGRGSYNTIWIDFNDNGSYENSERLLNNLFIDSTNTNFSIFIPSSAPLGYHNMRVRNVHYNLRPDSSTPPCSYYASGETEEYRVKVIATGKARAITSGIAGTCTPMTSTTIDSSTNNANNWVPLIDKDGNLVAALNARGNDLGTVKTKVYINSTGTRKDANNNYYLDRNIQITPAFQPLTNVGVRIYLLASELNSLVNTPGSNMTNISELNLTKNNDNCSSFLSSQGKDFPQTGNGVAGIGPDYYVEFSIPSFSSFYMNGRFSVLPIILQSFKVLNVANGNQLVWTCSNNNVIHKFEAEYSVDGIRFEKIGEIAATSQDNFTYSFLHSNIPQSKVLYYRLKITEKTGNTSYSEIRKISRNNSVEVVIHPNPVQDNIIVSLVGINAGNVSIHDHAGRTIYQKQFSTGQSNLQVDCSRWPQGLYLLRVSDKKSTQTILKRFVK